MVDVNGHEYCFKERGNVGTNHGSGGCLSGLTVVLHVRANKVIGS